MIPGLTLSPNVMIDLTTFWLSVQPYALLAVGTAVGVLVRHLWPGGKPAAPATPAVPDGPPVLPKTADDVWSIIAEVMEAEKQAFLKAMAARMLAGQPQTPAPAAAPKS